MKKISSGLLVALISLCFTTALLAGGGGSSAKPLDGAHPIVLSHGILGFDDTQGMVNGLVKYWGGMDDYLRSEGASVLTPGKTAMQGLDYRANEQRSQILYWMAANGFSKVHIIGHSQGGLDSRYMITNLGMSSKTSSLTSLNSVHHGTPVADIGLAVIPDWLEPSVAIVLNAFGQLVYGGGEQDILTMAESLTTSSMASFNASVPNAGGTDYFSYGSYMTLADPIQHPIMFLTHPICWTGGLFNGQGAKNDGVVPYSSQKWGTWKGGPSYGLLTSGVDHLQATNLAQTGQLWYDVEAYYLKMAQNAKNSQ